MKTKEQLLSEIKTYLINNYVGLDYTKPQSDSLYIDDELNIKNDYELLAYSTKHAINQGSVIVLNTKSLYECYTEVVTKEKINLFLNDKTAGRVINNYVDAVLLNNNSKTKEQLLSDIEKYLVTYYVGLDFKKSVYDNESLYIDDELNIQIDDDDFSAYHTKHAINQGAAVLLNTLCLFSYGEQKISEKTVTDFLKHKKHSVDIEDYINNVLKNIEK